MQGYEVQHNSASYPLVFLLISSSDHITGLTGATATVTISKNGGSFGSPSGSVTEIANGWYKVAGNATDTNTLGPLVLHASASGSDPCDLMFPVIAPNPQDAVHYGLTALPNTACTTNASLLTSGTGTDQLSVSSGKVALASTGLDAVTTETGINAAQAIALIMDMVCAKLSGLPGGPAVIRDVNDSANRVTITFDGNNNRTAVTLNPPSV